MGNTAINPASLSAYIDHTLLKPDAQSSAIARLCEEAMEYGFYSVCVNSQWVAFCQAKLEASRVKISAVCGFPLGAMHAQVKSFEAAHALDQGAAEIDMVLPIGLLLEANYEAVAADIRQVVHAVENRAIVKVILETGFLNDEQKRIGCQLAEQAGAHFVKTSTGFGPGGAAVEDIRIIRAAVSASIGVKASGGIRDAATALQMIEAGANRLGTSSGIAIVNGFSGTAGY
jgi:deoxyribose-phosphate aldolase